MFRYSAGFVKFSLLAVVKDKREEMMLEIASFLSKDSLTDGEQEKLNCLQLQLQEDDENYASGKFDNEKRRTNFIPFLMELLQIAAENEKLEKFLK